MKDYFFLSSNTPAKPTRDQIINVQGNFCNLFDSDGIPIFDIFIDELILNDQAKAIDWTNILKAANTTHVNLRLSGDYDENLGWISRYPIPGHDWTDNLSGFSQIIDWVQARGFIPIIKLALDGQSPTGGGYVNSGLTYGWEWGMNNMQRILSQLTKYTDSVLWSTGFDGCFPDWSRNQTIIMLQLLRDLLGPNACIDTEFSGPGTVGYSHMGNGPGDWMPDELGILDNFSIEVMTYPPDSVGVQQTASRLLGPAARNIDPPNVGPYYLARLSKKINICLYESIAFQAIRKLVTSENAREAARACANYGFSSFGNGLP